MNSEVLVTPEDEARYMQVMADYDESMRREAVRVSKLKAVDHHTKCRDCGVFVDKSRWVNKESYGAINRGERPLCNSCWSEYDYDY